jgi:glucose/arabinose dehydrogenase
LAWKGNLMVGGVVRGRVNSASGVEHVVRNDRMWETRRETLLTELEQRIRDVRHHPASRGRKVAVKPLV